MSDVIELYTRAGIEVMDRAAAIAGERPEEMQWGVPYEVDHRADALVRMIMGGYLPDGLLPHVARHSLELTDMVVGRMVERVQAQGGLTVEDLAGTFHSLLLQSVAVGARARQLIDEAERAAPRA